MKRLAPLLLVLLLLSTGVSAQADAPVTRGGFLIALWDWAGGVPCAVTDAFSDVAQGDDCATAVAWAHSLCLVNGTGDGHFSPLRPITREESATLLRRYGDFLGWDTATASSLAQCNDFADISPWADDALYWATDLGILPWADGGRLAPLEPVTGDLVTQMLRNFLTVS